MLTMSLVTPPLPLYNDQFSAANVWEFDVPHEAVDEAASLFAGVRSQWQWEARGSGSAATAGAGGHAPHRQFSTRDGNFFELRREGWNSDISWISADDEHTHERLQKVFSDFNLQDTVIGDLVPGSNLRMFAAFYVSA